MLPAPLHWYLALVILLGVAGAFGWSVARDDRREWMKSGRRAAEYDERLRQNRRRLLPLIVLLAVVFLLRRLGVFSEEVARCLPVAPVVLFVPFALYELWTDRRRLTQDKTWWVKVLWHAALLVVLSGLTWLVMPFLLRLP